MQIKRRMWSVFMIITLLSLTIIFFIQYGFQSILFWNDQMFINSGTTQQYRYAERLFEFNETVISAEKSGLSAAQLSEQLNNTLHPTENNPIQLGYTIQTSDKRYTNLPSFAEGILPWPAPSSPEDYGPFMQATNYVPLAHQHINDGSADGFDIYALISVSDSLVAETRRGLMVSGLIFVNILAISLIGIVLFYRRIRQSVQHVHKEIKSSDKNNLKEISDYVPNDEIGDLLVAFNEMKARLDMTLEKEKELDENRRFLISSLSHDLKTPIMTVRGYLEGILDGIADTPDKQEHYIRISHETIKYTEELIKDLFLYSRLNLDEEVFSISRIELGSFFDDLTDEMLDQLEDVEIQIVNDDRSTGKQFISGDTMKLRRVFKNIVENAIKYNDYDSKKLDFSFIIRDGQAIFSISDNGLGIPETELQNIFNRFTRLDKSRNEKPGSGLGLAICKEIVEKHEGTIRALPSKYGGLTIEISLPLMDTAQNTASNEEVNI